jgi:hypothetical protein
MAFGRALEGAGRGHPEGFPGDPGVFAAQRVAHTGVFSGASRVLSNSVTGCDRTEIPKRLKIAVLSQAAIEMTESVPPQPVG